MLETLRAVRGVSFQAESLRKCLDFAVEYVKRQKGIKRLCYLVDWAHTSVVKLD